MQNLPPHYSPPGQHPAPIFQPSPNRKALKWIGVAALVLFALGIGLIVLLLIGAELLTTGGANGALALVIGLLFAMVPVPFYVMLVLWIDRYEAEPLWLVATAFLWGATIAAFIAFLLNSIGEAVIFSFADERTAKLFGAIISAPIVEESAKAAALFVLFFWKRDEFDGIVDGVVYASMIALGFAMTENIKYYGEAALAGGQTLTATFILRGTLSPFAHPLFTSMTGIGLGWSRQSTNKAVIYLAPLAGLLAAIGLHATWNLSAAMAAGSGIFFLAVYFLFMVPAFIVTLVVILFGLRRESRILRQFLACDVSTGFLSSAEVDRFCSVRGRIGSSFRALTSRGLKAWQMQMEINQLASELAFHRSRRERGFYSDPAEATNREVGYVNRILDLKRGLQNP